MLYIYFRDKTKILWKINKSLQKSFLPQSNMDYPIITSKLCLYIRPEKVGRFGLDLLNIVANSKTFVRKFSSFISWSLFSIFFFQNIFPHQNILTLFICESSYMLLRLRPLFASHYVYCVQPQMVYHKAKR